MCGEGGVPAQPICVITLDAASEQRLGRKVPKEEGLAGGHHLALEDGTPGIICLC